jgi:hypothetical protein
VRTTRRGILGLLASASGAALAFRKVPLDEVSIGVKGGGGSDALLKGIVENGRITAINVVNAGSGYTSRPTLVFSNQGARNISAELAAITRKAFVERTYGPQKG